MEHIVLKINSIITEYIVITLKELGGEKQVAKYIIIRAITEICIGTSMERSREMSQKKKCLSCILKDDI